MPAFVILEHMANGLLVGAYYIVLALGLSLIFSLGGVVNLAHGAFYALGAYLAYEIQRRLGFAGAMALSPIGVALIGVAIERLAIRRFYRQDPGLALLFTFGLAMAAEQSLRLIWGATGLPFGIPEALRGQVFLGDFIYSRYRIAVLAVSAAAVTGCWLLLNKTSFGLVVRAGTRDPEMVRALGIALSPILTAIFALGVGLAGLAGVHPAMGTEILVAAFVIVVIGGLGSFWGVVWAGLIVGVVRGLTVLFYPPAAEASMYALMVLVLLVRPRGLMGQGFNLLLGYTGLLSFGHGAFFGLAAYAAALVQIHYLPGHVLAPIALGTFFAAAMGLIVGFLALRRRGVYFSLLTLAFTALIFSVAFRWTALTGGENGLRGISRRSLLGLPVESQFAFYYLTAAIVLLVARALWRVVHSPLGRVLLAIRDNERRARFLGYPVQRYKLIAFTLSAAVTGLGGCLFTFLKVFASADQVHVAFSGEIVAMTIVGGMGHFLGPALGSAFFILFRELLSEHTASWQFWFGLMFMAFILFSPSGLIGLGERLLRPFRRRAEEAAAMAARLTPRPATEVPDFLRGAAPAAGPLLDCRMVTKRFGDFTAVDSVDLTLADRRLHALIGPNGAGKTTLFNAVSGMYPPDGGSIVLDGRRIDGLPPERVVGQGIARSFQITNLFPSLTLFENLRLAVQARDPRRFNCWRPSTSLTRVNEETRALVRFLGLEGLAQVPASSLSYGGQRLLELGLPLAACPRVLLLDEPLAGLAAAERERITALLH